MIPAMVLAIAIAVATLVALRTYRYERRRQIHDRTDRLGQLPRLGDEDE